MAGYMLESGTKANNTQQASHEASTQLKCQEVGQELVCGTRASAGARSPNTSAKIQALPRPPRAVEITCSFASVQDHVRGRLQVC